MKQLIFSFLTLMLFSSVYGQSTDVTYKVTNYSINGENFDNLALAGDVSLSFYMCDDNTVCFTNHWRNNNSQSYGGVYSLKTNEFPETSTTYAYLEIKFTWHFFNTYNSKSGKALVNITNVFIGNSVTFTAEIIVLDTNEVLLFKGYLE